MMPTFRATISARTRTNSPLRTRPDHAADSITARSAAGFTLMELIIVVGIISLIAAIVVPQLAPVIAFSSNEGAARKLAGYGQNAMSRAQLFHDDLTVMVDLKNQEYWTMLLPSPPPIPPELLEAVERGEYVPGQNPAETMNPLEMLEFARAAREEDGLENTEDKKKFNQQALEMKSQFDHRQRRTLETQALRVQHDDDGMLADIGPEFSEFSFDEEEELAPRELREPLLLRSRLPDGIWIDKIRVGEELYTQGTVEIEISPIGLEKRVAFHLTGRDGDDFTVQWDPVIGTGRLMAGDAFQ